MRWNVTKSSVGTGRAKQDTREMFLMRVIVRGLSAAMCRPRTRVWTVAVGRKTVQRHWNVAALFRFASFRRDVLIKMSIFLVEHGQAICALNRRECSTFHRSVLVLLHQSKHIDTLLSIKAARAFRAALQVYALRTKVSP